MVIAVNNQNPCIVRIKAILRLRIVPTGYVEVDSEFQCNIDATDEENSNLPIFIEMKNVVSTIMHEENCHRQLNRYIEYIEKYSLNVLSVLCRLLRNMIVRRFILLSFAVIIASGRSVELRHSERP